MRAEQPLQLIFETDFHISLCIRAEKWTRILIVSSSIWDSLGTWRSGTTEARGRQSTVPSICSLRAAFLEFRPQTSWKLIKSEMLQTKHISVLISANISVFFNEATFHNNVSDRLYCQEQFFLFLPLLPLCFYSPWTPCPPLFYCYSSNLPFFLCFFNLLKAFFISPQSQTRSTSVSFCPQTLYLLNETEQSPSYQANSCFCYTEGKHWSTLWIHSVLFLILQLK